MTDTPRLTEVAFPLRQVSLVFYTNCAERSR
jgi:hypothetical protein